jgi:hypothetical protein
VDPEKDGVASIEECVAIEGPASMEAQRRIQFRDIVTGDESWIYLDVNANSLWMRAGEKVPTRSRTLIALSKAILTVFCGLRNVVPINWLVQGMSFKGAYFDQDILWSLAAEPQGEGRPKRRHKHCSIWTLPNHTHQYRIWP